MIRWIKALALRLLGREVRFLAFPVFRENIYSQAGEDGVLDFIVSRLRDIPKLIVDLGANDGLHGSNSRLLLTQGWRGILIEPYTPAYEHCAALYQDSQAVDVRQVAVTPDPASEEASITWHGHFKDLVVPAVYVNDLLGEMVGDRAIGILKVDLDGMDDAILEAIDFERFRPWVVMAEIDSSGPENLQQQTDIMTLHGYHPVLHIGNVFYIDHARIGSYLFQNRKSQSLQHAGLFKRR